MAVPTVTSINPATAWFTDPPFTLVVTGTNFDETSEVLWGGVPLPDPPVGDEGTSTPTDLVSPTELHAQVDPSTATYDDTTMSAQVWVANGPDWSNIMTFTFAEHVDPPIPPEEGKSPNTPAVPAEYMPPVPPDVYQKVATP